MTAQELRQYSASPEAISKREKEIEDEYNRFMDSLKSQAGREPNFKGHYRNSIFMPSPELVQRLIREGFKVTPPGFFDDDYIIEW